MDSIIQDNGGQKQPFLPTHKKILRLFDKIQEKIVAPTYIDPKKLLTKNRKDIEYRLNFLNDVFNKNLDPSNTLYSQFISDADRGFNLDEKMMINNFLTLFKEIKKDVIIKPLLVAKYNSDFIKTRYVLKGKKHWKDYKNETGFQLIDGAHRLAATLFFDYKEIPAQVYHPLSFEVPNYTDYIAVKEPEYLNNLR